MTASSPKILCRVRALYPFHSTEGFSLNFDRGDYIDVLSKLESGWWDGWCKNRRGWFPSNYVEIVTVEDQYHPADELRDSPLVGMDTFYSNNTSTEVSLNNGNLSNGWTIQVADDDSTCYYYNKRTGEIKYAPPILPNSDGEEEGPYDLLAMPRNGSIDSDDGRTRDEFHDANDYPLDEITAPRRLSVGFYESDDEHEEALDVEAILSQWVQRKTPQGRVYYCNLVTQETTWNSEEIDPSTGRLRRAKKAPKLEKQGSDQPSTHLADTTSKSHPTLQTTHLSDDDKPLTWQKLSADIAVAIQHLNNAAQRGRRDLFHADATAVVESIRIMLYASRSMEKESARMQDQALREPRRAVMASLSKLVLSAKMASEIPLIPALPSEPFNKVQSDADDVLKAVRVFVTICQQRQVEIEFVNPKLLEDTRRLPSGDPGMHEPATDVNAEVKSPESSADGFGRRSSIDLQNGNNSLVQKTKYPLNQDLIVSLQTHANQIYGSTSALCMAVKHILTVSEMTNRVQSNIVLLFRNLSSQISQYLGILGDIDVSNIDSSQIPSLSGYRVNKQSLYTSVGQLFGDIQRLTDKDIDTEETVRDIENSTTAVERVIKSIEVSVSEMVEQRKHWFSRRGEFGSSTPTSPRGLPLDESRAGGDDDDATTAVGSVEDDQLRSLNVARTRHQPPLISTSRSVSTESRARTRRLSVKTDDRSEMSDTWYLGQEHGEGEIFFSSDGNIKGGTLPALVERLTLHDTLDTSFIATFLLTYRSFCTTEEFVSLLEQRYSLRPPEGLTPDELVRWTEQKQKLVRLRVFNVIKTWLDNYYNDEDAFILNRLQFFTATVIRDASTFASDQLNRLIRKRMKLNANGELKKLVANKWEGPTPIMPKNMMRIQLLETDPLEIARQLSMMDFKLYNSIQPVECLNKAWSRDDAVAINVKQSIDYCNRLTAWVTDTILSSDEAKKRATMIKYWAQVADRCRLLNNYNTCMAILSSFDNSAIGRLRKTWEAVGKSTNQILNQIRKLMGANRNFTEYREMIHSVNPPCIPFLGIYLQDLTFIEDGNPDHMQRSDKLINFAKRQKTAEVIREIKQFQSSPYAFQEVPELQHFIRSHLEASQDVETLYEKSLQLEPRVTETS
ncbi:hypothetical protein DFQ28_006290 [Apophysomyces sp. BC1034]|nr:hypothetical protein DFQ30_006160 [Apophysomyces sp. BC1015]KAG0177196.1 hypothetical protein DFQ29_005113 [Apophysomyces sp. BC1021]KAG0187474.1 hypothetical protein DFQ28_006290 [Apophysomyces sp. BC1034]